MRWSRGSDVDGGPSRGLDVGLCISLRVGSRLRLLRMGLEVYGLHQLFLIDLGGVEQRLLRLDRGGGIGHGARPIPVQMGRHRLVRGVTRLAGTGGYDQLTGLGGATGVRLLLTGHRLDVAEEGLEAGGTASDDGWARHRRRRRRRRRRRWVGQGRVGRDADGIGRTTEAGTDQTCRGGPEALMLSPDALNGLMTEEDDQGIDALTVELTALFFRHGG